MTAAVPADSQVSPRRGQLALALQEAFTAITRLRANRQVAADAESFRTHIKTVLGAAEAEGRRAGYAGEDVRLALFAVIALLDESVLNSQQPMFADWPRRPLQDEIFQSGHMAGELFFQYLQQLMQRPDSEDAADLLEVFQLCLLLGFRGRYGASQGGDLHAFTMRTGEKITRVRGPHARLAPRWRPPDDRIEAPRDRWARPLLAGAAGAALLALVLFVGYTLSLRSGASDVRAEAAQVAR
ncbi:MAG TPA: DotU family type IV/VI secretion system protein [Gemmatimonadaceae bacterium]|nr:DotU family type IV/VI secretion system protein [Gemmatimonadaceae bacterium]